MPCLAAQVFGDAINLSARLMVKAKKGQPLPGGEGLADVLCDEPTYAKAKFKAQYQELEPMSLKGKQLPVVVFAVTPHSKASQVEDKLREKADGEQLVRNGPQRPLVGRSAEMALILSRVSAMFGGQASGGLIIIEGNTGAHVWGGGWG